MEIPQVNIDDYNYFLPQEKIAQFPLVERDKSKLLAANVTEEKLSHYTFQEIPSIIPSGSLLVRNNTKVFPARLFVMKPTGGNVEILIESPESFPEPQIALHSKGPQEWLCTVRGKHLDAGLELTGKYNPENEESLVLTAKILEVFDGKRIINFRWTPEYLSFAEFLDIIGKIPLPPYIHRPVDSSDLETYQTVFAKVEGSIAAPTAGLHFTQKVLDDLEIRDILVKDITLHVGSGTFVPMKTNKVEEHKMHSEQFTIDISFLKILHEFLQFNEQNKIKKKIIATGTTTSRTLETLYWLGKKVYLNFDLNENNFNQWEWAKLSEGTQLSAANSIECFINHLEKSESKFISGSTSLFIVPGYDFKIINGLITNFHLPKSTLLLLIAAFAGNKFYSKIYEEAILKDYRFLSYGDSSIIFK